MKKFCKNFNKKQVYLSVIIVSFFLSGCSSTRQTYQKSLYETIPDFNISEIIKYENTPFSRLVDQANVLEKKDQTHFINVLDIGDEALLVRIHLIRNAQKTINIQTFIWSDDDTGRYVAKELVKAAQRGVKVKIIIDQFKAKNGIFLAAYLAQAHQNLEVKFYNPSANQILPSKLALIPGIILDFKKINQRMHNKIFIVDDQIAITGGRNYENDYYDRGETRNFKDRDVLVVGPVASEMTESFEKYWAYYLSVSALDVVDIASFLRDKGSKEFLSLDEGIDFSLFKLLDKRASNYDYIDNVFVQKSLSVSDLSFVYDDPGKNNSRKLSAGSKSSDALNDFLSKAKKTLVIQTPYLVLDKKATRRIKHIRRMNPDLDILISSNSLAATDSIYAYSFAYKQKKKFVKKLKFRIFEFKPVPEDVLEMMPRYQFVQEEKSQRFSIPIVGNIFSDKNSMESQRRHLCLHAKTFVVDKKSVWIGSFNIDPRSANLNTEAALIVYDEAVSKEVYDNIVRDMMPQNSWTVGPRKKIPGVSLVSGLMSNVNEYVPVFDIWPFQYTTSYQLIEGKEVVPFYDDQFFENYKSVGSFPQVNLSLKEIQVRLLKSFAGVVEPII